MRCFYFCYGPPPLLASLSCCSDARISRRRAAECALHSRGCAWFTTLSYFGRTRCSDAILSTTSSSPFSPSLSLFLSVDKCTRVPLSAAYPRRVTGVNFVPAVVSPRRCLRSPVLLAFFFLLVFIAVGLTGCRAQLSLSLSRHTYTYKKNIYISIHV